MSNFNPNKKYQENILNRDFCSDQGKRELQANLPQYNLQRGYDYYNLDDMPKI
jgi:hypothetical protein